MTPADIERIRLLGPEKCPPDVQEDYRLASDYDAGLLNDHGGGNVDWWQDYLRAEIGRSNDHWRDQYDALAAEALDLRAKLAEVEADRDQGARDYCDLMDRHDALVVKLSAAEAALATAREDAPPVVGRLVDSYRGAGG